MRLKSAYSDGRRRRHRRDGSGGSTWSGSDGYEGTGSRVSSRSSIRGGPRSDLGFGVGAGERGSTGMGMVGLEGRMGSVGMDTSLHTSGGSRSVSGSWEMGMRVGMGIGAGLGGGAGVGGSRRSSLRRSSAGSLPAVVEEKEQEDDRKERDEGDEHDHLSIEREEDGKEDGSGRQEGKGGGKRGVEEVEIRLAEIMMTVEDGVALESEDVGKMRDGR
jgi:hypothetical protein